MGEVDLDGGSLPIVNGPYSIKDDKAHPMVLIGSERYVRKAIKWMWWRGWRYVGDVHVGPLPVHTRTCTLPRVCGVDGEEAMSLATPTAESNPTTTSSQPVPSMSAAKRS